MKKRELLWIWKYEERVVLRTGPAPRDANGVLLKWRGWQVDYVVQGITWVPVLARMSNFPEVPDAPREDGTILSVNGRSFVPGTEHEAKTASEWDRSQFLAACKRRR